MIEAEKISPHLMLEDPVLALKVWSRDPSLTARSRMCDGRAISAVELQSLFLDEAMRFVENGGCEGIVPRAGDIIELWADTLVKLRARDFPALARRLDWVLKKSIIEGVIDSHAELDWKHPTIKRLDLVYSSLDPGDGLYWTYQADGLVDSVVSDADIRHFLDGPPADTRAWARAMLLRRAGRDQIAAVDWDFIRFRPDEGRVLASERTFDLANPLKFTRRLSESLFDSEESLDALLDALERSGQVEH
jgi:proteasome accessory factor A